MSFKKTDNFFYKNRMALLLLGFALVYNIIIVNRLVPWRVDEYALFAFYAVDFSFGFATRILPGAVFQAIFGSHATRENATLFVSLIVLAIFALSAFLLQTFLSRIPLKHKQSAFVLVLLSLSGGYSFAVFTRNLGLLETYWLLCVLLFFAVLEHKWLRFSIPLLFALCIFVHSAGIVNYIVLMSIVLLLRICTASTPREKRCYRLIFVLSVTVAVGLFVFFTLAESKMVCSREEFHRKLAQNGATYYNYYDYAFFGYYDDVQFMPDSLQTMDSGFFKLFYAFYYRIRETADILVSMKNYHMISLGYGLLLLLPPVGFFTVFHAGRLRQKENFLRRCCALLMIVQFPFTLLSELILSVDFTRQLTHAFLPALLCVMAVLYYEAEECERFFEMFTPMRRSLWFRLYALVYVSASIYSLY